MHFDIYTDGSLQYSTNLCKCGTVVYNENDDMEGAFYQWRRINEDNSLIVEWDATYLGTVVARNMGIKNVTVHNDRIHMDEEGKLHYFRDKIKAKNKERWKRKNRGWGYKQREIEYLKKYFDKFEVVLSRDLRNGNKDLEFNKHAERMGIAHDISQLEPNGYKSGSIVRLRLKNDDWEYGKRVFKDFKIPKSALQNFNNFRHVA